MRVFRIILPVSDIDRAAAFYSHVLGAVGVRVSPGRHYFPCGEVILACFDPHADGDDFEARPNPDHIYIATDDLDGVYGRAVAAGARSGRLAPGIGTRSWGERSFYVLDPFENPLCFVDARTVFRG
jgi:catechol 2,3-dioxygenase-like lactoylglutathione lyase family enzyme